MTSLVELRVLEGPNLYFPRAAVKLTLDVIDARRGRRGDRAAVRPPDRAAHARPGAPGSGFRQRFALRAVERLVRAIAAEAGTPRLAVRVRPTSDPHVVVVAFPWRNRGRAQALGQAVADVLDALPDARRRGGRQRRGRRGRGRRARATGPTHDHADDPGRRGDRHQRQDHDQPDDRPHRAHQRAGSSAGPTPTASTSTACWSRRATTPGPAAPAGCWRIDGVQLAVTETARGGILLKGIGITRNDVSVVTNVTADHLGLQGIDTVDQLAEVKSRRPADHPQGRLGGAQRRRPAGARDAQRDLGAAVGLHPRPRLAGDPRGARPTAAGPPR